jgi:autotransporter-associated beta strand protein
VLATSQIIEGAGAGGGTINFNGGVLRATTDQANLLSGFEAGDVQLLSGGAYVDTNGHAVGISSVLQGAGGLTQQGAGTLTLSGVNTYTGGTTIGAATLIVAEDANLGAAGGTLRFNGSTLRTTAGFAMNRATTLEPSAAPAA